MKYIVFVFFFLILINVSFAQFADSTTRKEILNFQSELNAQFSNPQKSPLEKRDLKKFKSLEFFPINSEAVVEAKFVRTPDEKIFNMPTTIPRVAPYIKYGEAHFELFGIKYTLSIYQSQQLKEKDEYKDYLFLPFSDLTNGEETYAGGRFIDLEIPDGDTIKIDFNKAYNPYCAYNHVYSCPIPPAENHLETKILAGVKAWHK